MSDIFYSIIGNVLAYIYFLHIFFVLLLTFDN